MNAGAVHSVRMLPEKCTGCMACCRACPMHAIRMRKRKAVVLRDRCIDCGVCIRVCPEDACVARTDPLDEIRKYRYRIALVGPELYGQFGADVMPEAILQAVLALGFDEVHEIALECEEMTYALRVCVTASLRKRPILSFSCPAVVRLIAGRYPAVLDHVAVIRSPMGVAAKRLRQERPKDLGIPSAEIGLFYLTPCPARTTRIRQPLTDRENYFSGAIAVSEVYGQLLAHIRRQKQTGPRPDRLFRSNGIGIAWGAAGGETKALMMEDCLYVAGMGDVLKIMEEVDRGELADLDYLELMACTGGCVGGPLMVDNVSIARNKVQKLMRRYSAREETVMPEVVAARHAAGLYDHEKKLEIGLIDPLDADPQVAIRKMKERNQILATLPGIDCGACGAPTCRVLAEDVVQGRAERTDCVFVLFEQAGAMARQVFEWTERLPVRREESRQEADAPPLRKVKP